MGILNFSMQGDFLCAPIPGLQFAEPLNQHDLHLPLGLSPGRRAICSDGSFVGERFRLLYQVFIKKPGYL